MLVWPRTIPLGYRMAHSGVIVATAYNSLPNQTDDSPWITASGTRCREGVIASNHFPIGTKLAIEGYKGRVFTVEDRMNSRYHKRIDIWFRDYDDARQFGVRKVKYYVLASV
ncbi:MAG: 3D domain-containing protein [Candidatus Saganbacteria bacterium]|nr:3D domain-containing protein [Candidatus Saganbacteria bacterium]